MLSITDCSYKVAAKTNCVINDIKKYIINSIDEPQNYKPKYEKIHNDIYEVTYLLIKGIAYDEIVNRLLYDDIIDCIISHTVKLKPLGTINYMERVINHYNR